MRRALFISILALVIVSCNNSGDSNGSSDSTTMGSDTMTNMNNSGNSNGNTMGTDTGTMNGSNSGMGTDTTGRGNGDSTKPK